jgi:hypothetical protein
LDLKNVGAAFSRDKPSLAPLIAAESRSHNQETMVLGLKKQTGPIKPGLCFSEISDRPIKLLLIPSFRLPNL